MKCGLFWPSAPPPLIAEQSTGLCNTLPNTHYNTLQHTLQHTFDRRAVYWALQHTATNKLQHAATYCDTHWAQSRLLGFASHCNTNTATRCKTHCNICWALQHTATHTLQHTATHCNTHCNTHWAQSRLLGAEQSNRLFSGLFWENV